METSGLLIRKRSIADVAEKRIWPRLPAGVAQSGRVENACTPGRRVYPGGVAATIVGAEVRESYNAKCNAPPVGAVPCFH